MSENSEDHSDEETQQELIVADEDDLKVLQFLHKDYHDHHSKKRKFEELDPEDEDVSRFELTKLLMSRLDALQNDRYDTYRRTVINKTGLKRLTNQIFPHPLPPDLITILSSISKILMGEIIEKAKDVQLKYEKKRLVEQNLLRKALKLDGKDVSNVKIEPLDLNRQPLRPEHIRESWRLYQLEKGKVLPNDTWRKQGGDGDGLMFR